MEKHEVKTNIGEIIYEALSENCLFETEKWAIDRVENIMRNFHENCNLKKDYKVVIPWLNEYSAFTANGSHIFLARKLFQEFAKEAMVAFVIAHEIAHHKLGHMKMFPDSFSINLANNIKILLAGKYRLIESRLYGPEQECDADRLAIEMCIAAGYDPFECIEIFDKFEKIALDRNDLGAVFGPDEADDELMPDVSKMTKLKIWLYQRKRGYLPIRDRRYMVLHHLSQLGFNPDTTPQLNAA